MAELIYRIPSKVPYGYVEWRGDPNDPIPDPETLARGYAEYVTAYKKAEEAALQAPTKLVSKPAVKPVEDVLSEDEVVDLIVKELGGVPVEETAPWDDKPEVAKKEWEAPASDAWDFS